MKNVYGEPMLELGMEIGDLSISFFKFGELNAITYNDWAASHFHTVFEFQYIKDGNVVLFDGEEKYSVDEGGFFIIPPNTYHSNENKNEKFSRYTFLFSVNYNGKEDNGFSEYIYYSRLLNNLKKIKVMKSESISLDVEKLLALGGDIAGENMHRAKLLINILLADIVAEIAKETDGVDYSKNAKKSLTVDHEHEKIRFIIGNCVEAFYTTDATAERIAKELNMSRRNSARLIYEYFGENLSDIITRHRMDMAEILIKNTDKPLTEIAEAIGYKTYVAFFTAFKKHYGKSPLCFRENNEFASEDESK